MNSTVLLAVEFVKNVIVDVALLCTPDDALLTALVVDVTSAAMLITEEEPGPIVDTNKLLNVTLG